MNYAGMVSTCDEIGNWHRLGLEWSMSGYDVCSCSSGMQRLGMRWSLLVMRLVTVAYLAWSGLSTCDDDSSCSNGM